jgi:hypothetical protein
MVVTYQKETEMNDTRFNYKHPVFYSRKHPFYAKELDAHTRVMLCRWLSTEEAPF